MNGMCSGSSVLTTAAPPSANKLAEQPQLGLAIGVHVLVIVEMVAAEIGKAHGLKAEAVEPALVEPVAGGFQGDVVDAAGLEHRQARVQRQRIGRRERCPGGQSCRRSRCRACRRLPPAMPLACQIWRTNETTEVLPLVPVTATVTSGCGAMTRPPLAHRRRGHPRRRPPARRIERPTGGRSDTIAAAPCARRLRCIGVAVLACPGRAKNASPGPMARLSALTPLTSNGQVAACTSPFSRSVQRKFGKPAVPPVLQRSSCRDQVCRRRLAEIWHDTKHRGDALHDAAGHLACVPAGCIARLGVLGLRFIDE